MPPPLPDRYELHVRLGRDGDLEEWLATDTHLDRPVLIRYLGPESGPDRVGQFLASVRSAAATTHPHVQKVFAADVAESTAFSVSEWDGAVSIADRLRAGETFPVDEFLPNASGLASGLAAFHEAGGLHGSIDTTTIHFSAAHPAKLGGFGRLPHTATPLEDTQALAVALRTAVTGSANPRVHPSQVAEGLPSDVDSALDRAASGRGDAAALSAELRAVPYSPNGTDEPSSQKGGLVLFAVVAAVVVIVAAAGLSLDVDPSSDFLYPATPIQADQPVVPEAEVAVLDDGSLPMVPTSATVFDPLGDGIEGDDLVDNAIDGRGRTAWRTERYPGPLSATKAGVGLVFEPATSVSSVEIAGTAGTRYTIGWSDERPDSVDGFARTSAGTLLSAPTRIHLPGRPGGRWLLWLTHLPEGANGTYGAEIAQVRFLP